MKERAKCYWQFSVACMLSEQAISEYLNEQFVFTSIRAISTFKEKDRHCYKFTVENCLLNVK
jgi:hypothetical protein